MKTEDITSDIKDTFLAEKAAAAYSDFISELERQADNFNKHALQENPDANLIEVNPSGVIRLGGVYCHCAFRRVASTVSFVLQFGSLRPALQAQKTPEYEFLLDAQGSNILNMRTTWTERTLTSRCFERPEQIAAFCFAELLKRASG